MENVKREKVIEKILAMGDSFIGSKQVVPGMPYVIDLKGNVRNVETGSLLTISTDRVGYLTFDVYIEGNSKRLRIHRELAKGFLPLPERLLDHNIEDLVVHHKDSNRQNNDIDLEDPFGITTNMEWLTIAEHVQKHHHKAVKVKDICTGIIVEYEGIEIAADIIECKSNSMVKHISWKNRNAKKPQPNPDPEKIYPLPLMDKYQIKWIGDKTDWPLIKKIVATNIVTGEELIFNKLRDDKTACAETLGIFYRKIQHQLTENTRKKYNRIKPVDGKWLFKYIYV